MRDGRGCDEYLYLEKAHFDCNVGIRMEPTMLGVSTGKILVLSWYCAIYKMIITVALEQNSIDVDARKPWSSWSTPTDDG